VDIIIELEDKGIILIQRKNPPYGWAIPGGFVDYGESLEKAAVREALEETSLQVKLVPGSFMSTLPRAGTQDSTQSQRSLSQRGQGFLSRRMTLRRWGFSQKRPCRLRWPLIIGR